MDFQYHWLKAAAHQLIFCQRTADFLLASNQVKLCRAISSPHNSRFFVTTNRIEPWGQVIQNQDGAYSTDVTLMTFPYWLRCTQAPENCLGLPHTSWQGPTRHFEICHCQISPSKPWPCHRLFWIHCTLADKWQKNRLVCDKNTDKNWLVCGSLKFYRWLSIINLIDWLPRGLCKLKCFTKENIVSLMNQNHTKHVYFSFFNPLKGKANSK